MEVEVAEEANPYLVAVEEDSQDLGASCQEAEEAISLDSEVPSQEEVGANSQGLGGLPSPEEGEASLQD